MSLRDANKFVRLENQIKSLEAERDRLIQANKNLSRAIGIDTLHEEISRLKAEVESRTSLGYERLKKDRDAWKAKAEKMAEVLRDVEKSPYKDSDLKSLLETLQAEAKAALEEDGE